MKLTHTTSFAISSTQYWILNERAKNTVKDTKQTIRDSKRYSTIPNSQCCLSQTYYEMIYLDCFRLTISIRILNCILRMEGSSTHKIHNKLFEKMIFMDKTNYKE